MSETLNLHKTFFSTLLFTTSANSAMMVMGIVPKYNISLSSGGED